MQNIVPEANLLYASMQQIWNQPSKQLQTHTWRDTRKRKPLKKGPTSSYATILWWRNQIRVQKMTSNEVVNHEDFRILSSKHQLIWLMHSQIYPYAVIWWKRRFALFDAQFSLLIYPLIRIIFALIEFNLCIGLGSIFIAKPCNLQLSKHQTFASLLHQSFSQITTGSLSDCGS